jgi:uncharacterized membrane protein
MQRGTLLVWMVFPYNLFGIIVCLQFTRSGHTQLQENAIMITSTITVVLFSTVVRDLIPLC